MTSSARETSSCSSTAPCNPRTSSAASLTARSMTSPPATACLRSTPPAWNSTLTMPAPPCPSPRASWASMTSPSRAPSSTSCARSRRLAACSSAASPTAGRWLSACSSTPRACRCRLHLRLHSRRRRQPCAHQSGLGVPTHPGHVRPRHGRPARALYGRNGGH